MSRDFLLVVFFMNQFPPISRVSHSDRFEFFRKFAEIFVKVHHRYQRHRWQPVSLIPAVKLVPVSMTPAANLPPVSATPAANFATRLASVVDTTTPVANLPPVSTTPAVKLPPVSTTLAAILPPVSTTPAANLPPVTICHR